MTVLQAINKIRPLINDNTATRWDDDRIIDVLNEGQRAIVKNTKIHMETTTVPLVAGTAEYTLPANLYALSRVTFEDKAIPFQSYDYMDSHYSHKWELDGGPHPQFILTNKSDWDKIRVYPTPREFYVTDFTGDVTDGGPYGAITLYESAVGVTETIDGNLYVTYQRVPVDVTNAGGAGAYTDVVDIEDIYLDALIYYTASTLLLDSDSDVVLAKQGKFEMKYREEVGLLKGQRSTNFTSTQGRSVDYRRSF